MTSYQSLQILKDDDELHVMSHKNLKFEKMNHFEEHPFGHNCQYSLNQVM